MNKRGQVTIFIIVGIIIVVAVGLFFVLRGEVIPSIGGGGEISLESYMETCIEEDLGNILSIMNMQGGYMSNPLNKTFKFENEEKYWDISYLCYTQEYFEQCVNQESLLIQHLNQEIKQEISDEVENCFDSLLKSLDKKKYVVDTIGYKGFELGLENGKINFDVNTKLTLTKNEETSTYEDIEFNIPNKIYDIAIVVEKIVEEESKSCGFKNVGFMINYPEFKVDKFRTGESILIYTVEHIKSKEKFRFAIRGCVIPPII